MRGLATFVFGAAFGLALGGAAGATVNFLTMTDPPRAPLNAAGVAFGVNGLCCSGGKMWHARHRAAGGFECRMADKPK